MIQDSELTETALRGFLAAKHSNEYKKDLSIEEQLNLLHKVNEGQRAELLFCQYVNFLLTIGNPCTPDQGLSKPGSHPCQTIYLMVKKKTQMEHDYVNLLNSIQRHTLTTCSTKYRLRENDKSELHCRFNFPF